MLNNGAPLEGPEQFAPQETPSLGTFSTLNALLRTSSLEQLEWKLRHASHLYNLLIPFFRRGVLGRWFTERKAEDSFILRSYPPRWVNLWNTTEGFLEQMRGRLREAGVPFVIMLIPQRLQILVDQSQLDPDRFDADKPAVLMKAFASRSGIPVLDLLPSFRDASREAELYFPVDGHPNATGARVIAENAWAFLHTLPDSTSIMAPDSADHKVQ